MGISKDIIEAIKNRAQISDIIGRYIALQKRGKNHFGLCPFHQEKSPSFSVSNEKNMFHCFGCHESGDVFTFLIKYKNISYPEAIKEVAAIVDIPIIEENIEHISEKVRMDNTALQINSIAADCYHRNLTKNSSGYSYLASRQIDEHDMRKFKLGFAPESWDFVYSQLKKKNYQNESILHSGIAMRSEKNDSIFDRFRNKIMFPIYNEKENVIGFGSRVLDNSLPKYINSSESSLFNKRRVLYGIQLAARHFRDKKYAIITEGYFDVIACHKYGFDTAVATLGTAITADHLSILSRFGVETLYLVFDPDEAGVKACFKAITLSSDFNFVIKVIMLDTGLDPMDYLTQKGREAFLKKMEDAVSPIDFVISITKKNFDLTRADSRIGFVKHVFLYMKQLSNNIIKDEFLRKLSEVTGIDEASIRSEYQRNNQSEYRVFTKDNPIQNEKESEKKLLFLLLANEALFKQYSEKIHYDFFQDDFCRKAYKAAWEKIKTEGNFSLSEIVTAIKDTLDDKLEKEYFSDEIFKEIYTNKPDIQLELLFNEIRLKKIEAKIQENKKAIEEREKQNADTSHILKSLSTLSKEKKKIKTAIQAIPKF